MVTVKTTFIPKGKLIQIMADTEVADSLQLQADEKAKVIIEVEKVAEEKPKETQ